MTTTALALVIALAGAPAGPRYDADAVEALDAMQKAAAATNDYTMRLVRSELIDRKLTPAETITVKWQKPGKIYLRQTDSVREGQETIYVPGWNKNRLKVSKWFNWNLDPHGTLAMAHTHHPITEVGLIHLVGVVLDNVRRAREKNVGTLTLAGKEKLFGRPVTRVEATMPATGKSPTIEKGQTLWDVAKSTDQSMYVILNANRGRGWQQAEHPKPGDAVIVPDFYGGRLVLWIDDALHLPIQIDVYDHEGTLYEHYEHHDLKVNVGLTAADFDPANPKYKF
jgi:outer membrane lipoprotein-sorting protein